MKDKRTLTAAVVGAFIAGVVAGFLIFALVGGNADIPISSGDASSQYSQSDIHTESEGSSDITDTTANTTDTTPPVTDSTTANTTDTAPPVTESTTANTTDTTPPVTDSTTANTTDTTPPVTDSTTANTTDTTPPVTDSTTVNTTEKPQETESGNQNGSYPEWESEKVYVGGDMVVYNGRIYRAKWWTQNEVPGESDVWEDTKTSVAETKQSDIATTPDKDSGGGTAPLPTDFRVIGYYPSWYDTDIISPAVQTDKLTHIIYAFAIPSADGGLRELESPNAARALIEKGHAAGVKVMLAVGGWSYNDTPLEPVFMSATETDEKINKFADAIIKMCDDFGFDGIDIDWEHPRIDGTSYMQYEKLMLVLSERLHANNKLLSSAVLSGATPDGNIYYDAAAHTDAVLNAVDWINVMAYDGGDGERHSGYDFAVACGEYWLSRGMPASKINLGVPFYGRPSWAAYRVIIEQDNSAAYRDISTVNGMEAHYNGIPTIKKKTAYAKEHLGGIMIWELTQDAAGEYSLLSAIHEQLTEG